MAAVLWVAALAGAAPAGASTAVFSGGRMALDSALWWLPDPQARWSPQDVSSTLGDGLFRPLSPWLAGQRLRGGGWLRLDVVAASGGQTEALLVLHALAPADLTVYARRGDALWGLAGQSAGEPPMAFALPLAQGEALRVFVRVARADALGVSAVLWSPPAYGQWQRMRRAGWALLGVAALTLALLGAWRWYRTRRTREALLVSLGLLYALGAGVLAGGLERLGVGSASALGAGLSTAALAWAVVSGVLVWGMHVGLKGHGRQQGLALLLALSWALAMVLALPDGVLLSAVAPALVAAVGPLMVVAAVAGLVFTVLRERAGAGSVSGHVDAAGRLLFTALLVHGAVTWLLALGWLNAGRLAEAVFVVAGWGVLLGFSRLATGVWGMAEGAPHRATQGAGVPLARAGRGEAAVASVPALIAEQVQAIQATVSAVQGQEGESRRKLDELQTLFQSALHEMATPVAVLDAMVHSLNEAPEGMDAWVRDRVANMAKAAQHLQLLQGSCQAELRARDHGKRADWTAVCLFDLLEETAQAMAELSGGRHLLQVEGARLPPLFVCDRTVLRLVLRTLVGNAVKYSPAGSRVTLSGQATPSGVLLEVLDNGPGVSAQDLARLFEPQFRGDSARGTQGTGMGLALGRHLVEVQGGKLTVSSRPGQGFHATVYLPSFSVLDAGTRGGAVRAA